MPNRPLGPATFGPGKLTLGDDRAGDSSPKRSNEGTLIERDFPLVAGEEKRLRYRSLDAWRGVAAIIVAAFHLQVASDIYFTNFMRNAGLFVDFFFVLSGFVISHAYYNNISSSKDFAGFVIRRFGRLWPLHMVMLCLFLIAELGVLILSLKYGYLLPRPPFTEDRTIDTILPNIFLLNGIGIFGDDSWNAPSWSISTEFYTYIIFALCVLGPRRLHSSLMLGLVLLAGAFLVLAYAQDDFAFDQYVRMARCVFCFFVGHFVWRMRNIRLPLGPNTGEFLAVGAVVGFVSLARGEALILSAFVFSFAVYIFAQERGWLSRLLWHKAPQTLGLWSYSIYMVHMFIAFLLFNLIKIAGTLIGVKLTLDTVDVVNVIGPAVNDVILISYLCVVVAVASFTFRYIEQPGINAFTRLARSVQEKGARWRSGDVSVASVQN